MHSLSIRLIALAVVSALLVPSPAFAQPVTPAPASASQSSSRRIDLSPDAAGISQIAERELRAAAAVRQANPPTQPSSRRSVWKRPWMYVLVTVLAVVIVIVLKPEGSGAPITPVARDTVTAHRFGEPQSLAPHR